MNRTRASSVDAFGTRNQRNRIYPALEASDGSTLSLDFTQMSLMDSRFTFDRSPLTTSGAVGTATFINSSGQVQYADSNMFTGSELLQPSLYGWGAQNGATHAFDTTVADPNGNFGVPKLIASAANGSSAVNSSSLSVSSGLTHTLTFYVRAGTGALAASSLLVGMYEVSAFAPATGTILSGPGSTSGGGAISITGLTSAWTKVRIYITPTVSGSGRGVSFYPDGAQAGGKHVYVWGAQLNIGEIANPTYFKTVSTAYFAPRFEYNPTTLVPRGLLLEGSTTNYVLQSGLNPFASPTWQTAGTTPPTVTAGYTGNGFAPDNTSRPTRVQFPVNGGSASRITQGTSYATPPTTAAPYTVSVWMKSNTAGTDHIINILGTDGAGLAFTVTPTWQRFTLVNTSGTSLVGQVYISNNSTSVAADVLIWGAQLEAGAGASSHIPTGTATVTRAADQLTMSNIALMQWNQTAGTFLWDMDVQAETNISTFAPAFAGMYRAGPVRVIRFQLNNSLGTNPRIGSDTWTASPSSIVTTSLHTRPVGTPFKAAVAFANTGQSLTYCINGTVQTTATGTGTLATPTLFLMHQDPSAADTEYFPIHLRRLKYWPTNLSSSDLRSITT